MDEGQIELLRTSLLAHYDDHARPLPWRGDVGAYAVWVSEIMLQQTRVETVVPYFERWMESFSTVEALAAATQDEVLRHWEGLGYYSRARSLHRGAMIVRDRFAGAVPSTSAELRTLPGVGDYTSGAIASIAFGERIPAVDGNVRRVLARILDEAAPSPGFLRQRAAALVDPERPGDFNQALMELGATVCTPRRPQCGSCPWADACRARAQGTVELRPVPKRRRPVPQITFLVSVVVHRPLDSEGCGAAAVLLRQRPEEGLLGGLWECPTAALDEEDPDEPGTLSRMLSRVSGAGPRALPTVLQSYSHFRGEYRPTLFVVEEPMPVEGMRWFTLQELPEVALSVAQRRIVEAALESSPTPQPHLKGDS